jgi:eukaryotic-like serine/threonine-protein kinase
MATPAFVIKARYQVKGKPLGQGGMGIVYRAYDTATKRDVALKTLRGTLNAAELELFSKEWTVLAHVSHPNIIDILDTGEFEQDGEKKPFFVMPLLPGSTLEQLIANASTRLTVERVVGIAAQTCRGLQAAHEQGLIHRDLKPSNIFVMDDDTVKIIDFGVVHLAGSDSIQSIKGTFQYMAPEQIEMKPASPASDIFSLGVVCYQALTGRKPFARKTEAETVDAIRRHIPPPACELNPLVSQIVSRVIHKAMAKDPWHRFSTAREYSETLQKALNGQPIERFDREKIQPRIERAKKAQIEGDHQFASEILTELEAEGNIDPDMRMLRIQLDQAIRQKSIRQLLDSARTRLEEDEFPLALQKIQEVLGIDPDNADALGLRKQIEKQRSERQTENWFRLVEQHLHNNAFDQAKQALEEILKLNAKDDRAREMLVEVDRREQEVNRLRAEKEKLYQAAVSCYQHGEVSSALSKLERVLELHRQSPDSAIPDRDAQYQSLYNQIRTEREAARSSYAEGRRYLADRSFAKALELCSEFLRKSPGDPMFQALKLEAEEQQRQEQSSFIADVARRVESEADLDRRVNILKEAVDRYPDEPHFQQSLRLVRERRDLVNSIVGKARQYEERGQFNEALSQFDILRNIYAQYPGIEYEAERLKRRRDEQVREEAKGRWVDQIDRHLAAGEYPRARDLIRTAISEFPNDRELLGLERLAQQALARSAEAEEWLQRGQKLCFDRQFGEGLETLRKAAALDSRNAVIRAALLNALVEQARSVLGQDWRAAEPLIEQALHIDGAHPLARSLQGLVLDYKRQEIVNDCVSQVREMQANGDPSGALVKLEDVLVSFPHEVRLLQLRKTLQNMGADSSASTAPAPQPQAPPESLQAETPPQAPMETVPAGESRPLSVETAFTVDSSMLGAPPAQKAPSVPAPPRPAPRAPNQFLAAARRMFMQGGAALGRVGMLLEDWAKPKRGLSKLQWALICAAPVVLLLALIVTFLNKKPPRPVLVAPREYIVDVDSNVLNVRYRVDGNAPVSPPLHLSPGPHTVEALLAGYKPASQSVALSPGSPKPKLSFHLQPEMVRLQLVSDLKSGKVSLDGKEPVDLQDGGFLNESVTLSEDHTFSLSQAGRESLAFSFRADPGGMVTLSAPIKARDVNAVVISSLTPHARVYSSDSALKAGLKDQTQPIPAEGLELGEITPDTEILLDDGKAQRPLPMDVGNAPALTIRLANDPNKGTLEVQVQEPGMAASIDGRKPQSLHLGTNSLSMSAGTHVVQFTRDGYDPLSQTIQLKKGEAQKLAAFELKPSVRTASLLIDGATPGAEVLIDGNPRGVVGADGSFPLGDLSPGDHIITLRKADYEPKPLPRAFTVAQTVHISGAEGVLTPFGTLDFKISPPGATVTYQLQGEAETPAENGKTKSVKAGQYVVVASASGHQTERRSFSVEPGKKTPVDLTLGAVPAEVTKVAPKPTPSLTTRDYFEDPAAWVQDGAWWAHKSEVISWLHDTQGSFVVQLLRTAKKVLIFNGTRTIVWDVDYKDQSNRLEYAFDFKTGSIERKVISGGKTAPKAVTAALSTPPGDIYTIKIDITRDRIVIKDGQDNTRDEYKRANSGTPLGKFGFKGEVEMVMRKTN